MPLDPLTKRVQRRRKNGQSLRTIAAATGISKSTVARLLSGPKFKASLFKQQQLIGFCKARNEEQLTGAIAKATDRCLASLQAGDPARAGVYARAAKDLSQAAREQGESARMILAKPLQEAERTEDPEFMRARQLILDLRRRKQLTGTVVEAAAVSQSPPRTHDTQV